MSESERLRIMGAVRAGAEGAWEAIMSLASFPTVVAHKRYVARTLQGDAFEHSFEWARDNLDGRCRLCARVLLPDCGGSIRHFTAVDGRILCLECVDGIASQRSDDYTKRLEQQVSHLQDQLASNI